MPGRKEKLWMMLIAAILSAIAGADLSMFGEWAELISRVATGLSGVLVGGAVIKRPGDR